jgi:hypothetical protein
MTLARRRAIAAGLVTSATLALACTKDRPAADRPATAAATRDSVEHAPFGKAPDGTPVEAYTFVNAHGIRARILTYGGIIQSLETPDRAGQLGDDVHCFDDKPG